MFCVSFWHQNLTHYVSFWGQRILDQKLTFYVSFWSQKLIITVSGSNTIKLDLSFQVLKIKVYFIKLMIVLHFLTFSYPDLVVGRTTVQVGQFSGLENSFMLC